MSVRREHLSFSYIRKRYKDVSLVIFQEQALSSSKTKQLLDGQYYNKNKPSSEKLHSQLKFDSNSNILKNKIESAIKQAMSAVSKNHNKNVSLKNWISLKIAEEVGPSARVGHTCTYISPKNSQGNGKIYLIGGANHDGVHSDVHIFDLNSFSWSTVQSFGFDARYEHTAYQPSSQPTKIFVFGGANENGNSTVFQVYDTVEGKWCNADADGPSPALRTYHNGASFDDSLIVFGGGDLGTNPVNDKKVYIYNASTNKWKILETGGTPPEVRLGHAMIVVRDVLYVHGGMIGTSLLDDLFTLNIEIGTWTEPLVNGDIPSARAGHSILKSLDDIYIFGGMTLSGASNELYKLSTGSMNWSLIEMQQPSPSQRFDLACTTFKLNSEVTSGCGGVVSGGGDSGADGDVVGDDNSDKSEMTDSDGGRLFVLIHGGMNESGQMYNDAFYLPI